MFTPRFIKEDWVKRKGSNQLMQIEEYQTESIGGDSAKWGMNAVPHRYNGKVWCSWVNKNNALVTEPFLESDLEPVRWPEDNVKMK